MKKILDTILIILTLLPVITSCESDSIGAVTTQTRAFEVEITTGGQSKEQINCARFIVFDNASNNPKLDINEYIPKEEINGINADATGLSLILEVSKNKDKMLVVILNEPEDMTAYLDNDDNVSHPDQLEKLPYEFADVFNCGGNSGNGIITEDHQTLKNGMPMTGVKWIGEKHGYPVYETVEEAKGKEPVKMTVERAVARVSLYLKKGSADMDVKFKAGGSVTLQNTYTQGLLVTGTEADTTRYSHTYKDFGKKPQTVSISNLKTLMRVQMLTDIDVLTDKTHICSFYTPERSCSAGGDADKLGLEVTGINRDGVELTTQSVILKQMSKEGENAPTDINTIKRNNSYDVIATIKENDSFCTFNVTVKDWIDVSIDHDL